ncbi:MAG: 6-phospho-beta-glucosidase [Lachnospiraceae bacterium]
MKLTVIGGCGSRSLMLAKSLARQADELSITEVVFMDIDEVRVQIFGSMVREAFTRIAPAVRLSCTTDFQQAVMQADFIIITIRAGKEKGRITDERIALNHGVIGQETTGVGGFGMALRSIPILLDYCELIKQHSNSEVMVFNFTNPAGMVTQALRDQGYDFVYGICDAPSGFLRQVAALYETNVKDLEVRLIGLNHLSYFTSVKNQGKEILNDILKNPELYIRTDMRYFEPELPQHLGCMLNEYLYYYYYREKALENIQRSDETRGERIQLINDKMLRELGKYKAEKDFEKMLRIYSHYTYLRESNYMAGETSVARDEQSIPKFDLYSEDEGGYAGVALALIRAKILEQKGEMILCIPNGDVLPWLEKGDIIEISCEISKDGAKPKAGDYKIPESVKQLICAVKYYERTAAQAIVEQDAGKAVDALMVHPLVSSYSLAKEIVKDYFNTIK